MSSTSVHKRRCIVQKLDFENCIVTSIKTRARGRKKLRARITREIEHIPDIPKEVQAYKNSLNVSPLLTQKAVPQTEEPTSPVLIKKKRRDSSPVFFKKKNSSSPQNLQEDSIIEEISSSPSSPVFKTLKKHKAGNSLLNTSQDIKNVLGRMTSLDMFNSQENSSSDPQRSFQIEDFTQKSSQSIKISSVDSEKVKKNSSDSYSLEQNNAALSVFCPYSTVNSSNSFYAIEKRQNRKSVKKNYKKNSLLARLHKLRKKQASDKLLWQHQNRKNSPDSLKVSVINFWKEEFNYFLKCYSDFESTYVVVDSRWFPAIKNIKDGSVLQLHPPWQKLSLEEPVMTVLLNVICLEILDETKESIIQKKTFESLPADGFEIDKKHFINSLFSSCKSGFLC